MSQLRSVERLHSILSFIESKHFPTMDQLMAYLTDKDLQPTERTVQRDLKTLRDECFIDIQYNRAKGGYFVNEQSLDDMRHWMSVFELFNTARVVNDTLIKSGKNIQYIDFERQSNSKIGTHLGVILSAVVDRQKISFSHQGFWHLEPNHYKFSPHLLKQYQNRWYVYGCYDDGEFRSFALDRILDIKPLTETFQRSKKDVKTVFDDIIGMVFSISEIETVVLTYTSEQGKYIKTQPIHVSQKTLVDDEDEFRIQLRVRPNYELTEQILKQGERVTVIQPLSLRNEVKKRLAAALAKY